MNTATTTGTGTVLAAFDLDALPFTETDFYEIVWDGETIRVELVGSTAIASPQRSSRPAANEAEQKAARFHAYGMLRGLLTGDADMQSSLPVAGRRVRSLTARGTNIGRTGTVLRLLENRFKIGCLRAEVRTDGTGQVVWMDADRLTVLNPGPVYTPQEIDARAKFLAARSWDLVIKDTGLIRKGFPTAKMTR